MKVFCKICADNSRDNLLNPGADPVDNEQYSAYSLVSHLKERHKMSVGQYLNKYPDAQIISEDVQKLISAIPKTAVHAVTSTVSSAVAEKTTLAGVNIRVMRHYFSGDALARIPKPNPFYEFGDSAKEAIMSIENGENVWFVGPTGCGKTSLAYEYCAAAQRPIFRFNCNAGLGVDDFEGSQIIKPDRTIEFRLGILPVAALMGATLVIDEGDFAQAGVWAVFQRVLESNFREILIPAYSLEPIVADPEFRVIVTSNTAGRGDATGLYAGAKILNEALLNRFNTFVRMDYLTKTQELNLFRRRFPNIDARIANSVVDLAIEIRKAFKAETIHAVISTRDVVENIGAKLNFGISPRRAFALGFVNRLSDDDFKIVDEIVRRVFVN